MPRRPSPRSRRTSLRPYKLIVTDNPDQTLGEGRIRGYRTMLQAANAFVNDPAPYKQIIYDDGQDARELTPPENRLLQLVSGMLGYDVEETGE
jgi:hypothetical protein